MRTPHTVADVGDGGDGPDGLPEEEDEEEEEAADGWRGKYKYSTCAQVVSSFLLCTLNVRTFSNLLVVT